MKYHQGFSDQCISDAPVIFALGSFDGVHIGHQYLLACGRRCADERKALLTVLTFPSLPRHVLAPEDGTPLLTSPFHKRRLLAAAGVDLLIEVSFSEQLMAMSATQFIEAVEKMVHLDTWMGGRDVRFGCHGEGSCELINAYAAKTGMNTLFVDRIAVAQEVVSSSRIRSLVVAGALPQAEMLLGRPYSFLIPCWTVDGGRGVLDTSGLCLPPNGVYDATVVQGTTVHRALVQLRHSSPSSSTCEIVGDVALLSASEPVEIIVHHQLRSANQETL